jgi:hypothetical protein
MKRTWGRSGGFMPIDPSEIEALAKTYELAAVKLREAAEILRNGPHPTSLEPLRAATSLMPTPATNGTPEPEGRTRREQLNNWLAKYGPATRRQIRESSGIPHAAIAVHLVSKNFDKTPDGQWKIKEN